MTSMSTRRRALTAGISILALGAVAACSSDGGNGGSGGGDGDQTTFEAAQEAGSVTIGFAGEAPYSFEDENGELTGATVALHREIFTELGIEEIEGVQAEFGQLIPGLTAGRFDVISAGMSILPERCEQASFSEPEFMYTTALMVQEGNPHGLTDITSIAESDEDITFATMTGAIETSYAESLGIDAMQVGGPQDGMDAVANGRADAFALTGISLNWMANNSDAPVEVTESFVQEIDGVPQVGAGGTVFRDEDSDFLEAYNEVLADIVADEERYLDIVGEFGFTAEERPDGSLTTEQLCAGDLG